MKAAGDSCCFVIGQWHSPQSPTMNSSIIEAQLRKLNFIYLLSVDSSFGSAFGILFGHNVDLVSVEDKFCICHVS